MVPVDFRRLSHRSALLALGAVLMVGLAGCAKAPERGPTAAPIGVLAWRPAPGDGLLDRFAPVFVTERSEHPWNRIGTPAARYDDSGAEQVFVDPNQATIYRRMIPFESKGVQYTNLIYRVHFERSPFTWVPFNAGTGRNVGLFAIVTLDARERPLWVTTVHTCGCYHAILPTSALATSAWPEGWDPEGVEIYGESLPGLLHWPEGGADSRVVVTVRDGNHRVMDVDVLSEAAIADRYEAMTISNRPIADLDRLALGEGTTSFFHDTGRKRGLVKGASKPLETVLFGWWIWDFHVGRDRRYGPREETEFFYTTLNPRRKNGSDMWPFGEFLEFEGWKTGVVEPPPSAGVDADPSARSSSGS